MDSSPRQVRNPAPSRTVGACVNKHYWLFLFLTPALADPRSARYALILEDPPLSVVEDNLSKSGKARAAAVDHRRKIEATQSGLRSRLSQRDDVRFTGAVQTVLNAIFVHAPEEEAANLRGLPGVARVVEMEPLQRHMVRATDLVRAQEGWRNVNGEQNAGAGVRIGILDTGIDHNHPAFRDPSLTPPAGFPRCRPADCDFTSSKVIVARSYVNMLVLGDNPADSRPDDLTPRDRVGHGTAVAMVAAGVSHNTPLGPASGVAPRAYIGNYKIFGSPGVNDVTFDDVLIKALEDAIDDGMDIVVLSLGRPAIWAPEDRGSICDVPAIVACDPRADAVENASRRLLVVVSAGNDGDIGTHIEPALNTIHSPGTAPSALTVGATTNAQRYFATARVQGDVPQSLREFRAVFGTGPKPTEPLRGPVRDVAAIQQDEGRACSPISANSLRGAIALIQRGGCGFNIKVLHAQRAGAVGVIIQQLEEFGDFIFSMEGLLGTAAPAVMIGTTAGKALREHLVNNRDAGIVLDPAPQAFPLNPDFVAYFSSFGPSIGGGAIKPEVAAVGYPLYMATQSFDPNGDMYSPDAFISAQGTSFSAPMAAGAAALFKQRLRDATPGQVKSAVVNTASADVVDVGSDGREFQASVTGVGAGKVNAGDVARTTITIEPATLSFGYVFGNNLPISRTIRFNNHGDSSVDLRMEARGTTDRNLRLSATETSFTLGAGQSKAITFGLEGGRPLAGGHEGDIIVRGGATTLRIPYLYVAGDGIPANAIILRGSNFEAEVEQGFRIAFKLIDRYGVPVPSIPVQWRSTIGDGQIRVGFPRTDDLGISDASVIAGPRLGFQQFEARTPTGINILFGGFARLRPAISTDGVVSAASNLPDRGVAPGSVAAILGRNLADASLSAAQGRLPLALAGVSVSFDVPERQISAAGRIQSVSDDRIVVQVPWELLGLNSAIMKVSIGNISSSLYTVPLNDLVPAAYEFADPSTERLIASARHENENRVTTDNRARPGSVILLAASGLGPVDNQPATGEPSPAEPLASTRVQPTVTVGGQQAEVLGSYLEPGSAGIYLVRIRVPAGLGSGFHPVVLTANGISSKPASLPMD